MSESLDMASYDDVWISNGANSVKIVSNKIEQDLKNNMTKIAMPVTAGNQDSKKPSMKILDLKRVEHLITISGFIEPQDSLTATQVKNKLIEDVLFAKGECTLKWRGVGSAAYSSAANEVSVYIDKIKFTDHALRLQKLTGAYRYEVIMDLTVGESLTG